MPVLVPANRVMNRCFYSTLVVFCLALLSFKAAAQQTPVPDLLLKDFKPVPMLHVPETRVERARFPVVDIHSHLNDAGAIMRPHAPANEVVQWMDRRNIRQIVILSGGWGERLQRVLDTMAKPFPDRFVVFTQPDWAQINEADFGRRMTAQIEDAVRRGARGLKVSKQLGLMVRDASGKLVAVDDPRLDEMWAVCGRLGIPVAIHSGDPEAFFHPIDGRNERYEQLVRRPEYRFVGEDYPSHLEIVQALERVFARHPDTLFISLHFGNWPENLDYVSGVLRKHSNVYVEFGARQGELGRQPHRARKFFLEFPDRILFGTDGNSEAPYSSYFRWLESEDDYFDYYSAPIQGRWKIYGLNLPDDVLENVYHRNAEKMFQQFKGGQ
jgi:uncharacterized protein